MLDTTEYLLAKLSEESNEIAQLCSKALCFGLDDVWPDEAANPEKLTIEQRLHREINDFHATVEILQTALSTLPGTRNLLGQPDGQLMMKKFERVGKYMQYSRSKGRLK